MKETDQIASNFKNKFLNECACEDVKTVQESFYTITREGKLSDISNISLEEALDNLNSDTTIITSKDLQDLYKAKMDTVGDFTPEKDPQELHMVQGQLDTICEDVEFIKMQVMEGHNWPAWAFEHLSVACDNISEVTQFFKAEPDPVEDDSEELDLTDMTEGKPSAGLSKKQKSAIVKKAKRGEDIGKKGKSFEKIAKKAGGGEKGERIAAGVLWKNAKRK